MDKRLRHHVYVIELLEDSLKRKKFRELNPGYDPSKPPLYVGSTGHTPEERFANHKSGVKGNTFVQKYGLKLRPDLYSKYNPMTFIDADKKEIELAASLRAQGYPVLGGNSK